MDAMVALIMAVASASLGVSTLIESIRLIRRDKAQKVIVDKSSPSIAEGSGNNFFAGEQTFLLEEESKDDRKTKSEGA